MDALAETRFQVTSLLSWAVFAIALLPGGLLGYQFRLNGLWLSTGLLAVSFLVPFPTAELSTIAHRGFAGFALASMVGYFGSAGNRREEDDDKE